MIKKQWNTDTCEAQNEDPVVQHVHQMHRHGTVTTGLGSGFKKIYNNNNDRRTESYDVAQKCDGLSLKVHLKLWSVFLCLII